MKRISSDEYCRLFSDRACPEKGEFIVELAESSDYILPPRNAHSHKYSYGRALVIAGATGFSGAAALAANACERSGAGLTNLIVPGSIYGIAASRCDGAVVTPVPATESGNMSSAALDTILPKLERSNACVIGPGIGTGEESEEIVTAVIRNAKCPLVLDADALTVCGRNMDLLKAAEVPLILTPHEGEFARIGGDLSQGRLNGAMDFSARHSSSVLILKGFGTLIVKGQKVVVNPTGGPAMAKGGSGDVLCGILCALLAQGFDPFFSSGCSAYLHGLAGNLACEEKGEYSVAPSDLIDNLPKAFRTVTGKNRKVLL